MSPDYFVTDVSDRSHLLVLPILGRYGPDCSRELCMSRRINRPVFDFGACRVLAKKIVAFPVLRRSDGSGNEAATAVWTDVSQNIINTCGTERTFIGADACLK